MLALVSVILMNVSFGICDSDDQAIHHELHSGGCKGVGVCWNTPIERVMLNKECQISFAERLLLWTTRSVAIEN